MSVTSQSSELPATDEDEFDGASARGRAGIVRIAAAFSLTGLTWVIPFLSAITVLLPARLAVLDDANKVADFALLTVVGSVVALVSNILFGALSDRTRSRFGGRTPWIIAGAATSTVSLMLMSVAPSVGTLLLAWCLLQAGQNAFLACTVAIIADRVAPRRRGLISSVNGTSNVVAQAVGTLIGGLFATSPGAGFAVVGWIPIVGSIAVVLLAPDSDNRHVARIPITAKTFLDNFAFPRRNVRDFYIALVGRLFLTLSFFMVFNYQLYILTDYMGETTAEAGRIISIASLLTLVAGFIAGLVSGPISDRIDRRKPPIFIACALIAVGILPLLSGNPWTLLIFAGVAGLGNGIFASVDLALAIRVLPNPKTAAKDLGIFNMANSGGQIIAPPLVAGILAIGGFTPVILVGFVGSIIAGLLIFLIRSTR